MNLKLTSWNEMFKKIQRKGGKGPMDSVSTVFNQYVSGMVNVSSCDEVTFTYKDNR